MNADGRWREELETRRAAVRRILTEAGCDAGLVFSAEGHPQTFRYLTNFTPVLGDMWAVIGPSGPLDCVLNFTWQLDEARQLPPGGDRWNGSLDAIPLVVEALRPLTPRRLGVEGLDRLALRAAEAMSAEFHDLELVDVGEPVSALRRRKTELEVDLLRRATEITDAAFEAAREQLRPGMTENELAARLGLVVQSSGGRWAFTPLVQADREEAPVIRMPSDKPIEPGHAVMIDIGAEYEGYQADAARTIVVGEPNELQRRAWDTVQRAYDAAIERTRPGVPCRDVHEAARGVIEAAGFELPHRIGHGIGLGLSFEWPSMDTETATLEPGMTVCIEPAVCVAGAGTLKLEDDVLITDDGCEILTRASASLTAAG